MTTQEMIDLFTLIQDKYEAPYFDDNEIIDFLNSSQREVTRKILDADIKVTSNMPSGS